MIQLLFPQVIRSTHRPTLNFLCGQFQALSPNSFILFERSALLEASSFDGSNSFIYLFILVALF